MGGGGEQQQLKIRQNFHLFIFFVWLFYFTLFTFPCRQKKEKKNEADLWVLELFWRR